MEALVELPGESVIITIAFRCIGPVDYGTGEGQHWQGASGKSRWPAGAGRAECLAPWHFIVVKLLVHHVCVRCKEGRDPCG